MIFKKNISQLAVLALAAMPTALAGVVVAEPPAPDVPTGIGEPFTKSCYNIKLRPDNKSKLSAICYTRGHFIRSTELDLNHCLMNQGGLGWSKDGGWSRTACNISPANCGPNADPTLPKLEGEATLVADLQSSEGNHFRSSMDLANGVVNDDGYLTCFGIHDGSK